MTTNEIKPDWQYCRWNNKSPLIGKCITSIEKLENGDKLLITVSTGSSYLFEAIGDCCSRSWVEGIYNVEQVLGSPVIALEALQLENPFGGVPSKTYVYKDTSACACGYPDRKPCSFHGHDVIQYYGCSIITQKGKCTIDFRNDSNGYYGGNLYLIGITGETS